MRILTSRLKAAGAALFLVTFAPSRAHAQQSGYSVDDLEALISGGVSPEKVLDRANRGCLSFRVSSQSDARLKKAGASSMLISALHASCRTIPVAKVLPDPPRPKLVVKHDTVIVHAPIQHDTVVREVVRPDPVIPLATYMSHDFTTDRDAYVRTDSVCERAFSSNAYRISTLTSRKFCDGYWKPWMPAAVRITGTFTALGGTSAPYAYGFEFALDSTTFDMFTLQINPVGEFAVMHKVSGRWTPVVAYAKSAAVAVGVGAVNTLRIDVRGRAAQFYVNDQAVGQYLADAPLQGLVGVGIFGAAQGAAVLVNRVLVTQIQ